MWDKEPCEMDVSLAWLAEIPREEIPWYPTVEPDACMGSRDCLAFCPQDVFRWDAEAGHAVVTAPFRCVVGCRECAQVCVSHAISFPSTEEWLGVQDGLRVKVREKARGGHAVTP
jgi:NAD-dependent dihydropyrimidine dehydrogenase PreA subunit